MSLFNNGINNNGKSRFKVTPRLDIESQLYEVNPPSPKTPGSDVQSPGLGPFSTLAQYFSPMDDGSEEKGTLHNNTATTTSTSSNSSFYNTIYKYNKLKQKEGSMDPVYSAQYKRRASTSAHVVGISFYNERVLVYNFLQRPTGLLAISYHIVVSVAVVYCLVLTIMSTSSRKCASRKPLTHQSVECLFSFALT